MPDNISKTIESLQAACKYSSQMSADQVQTLQKASSNLESIQSGSADGTSLSDVQSAIDGLNTDLVGMIGTSASSAAELNTEAKGSVQSIEDSFETIEAADEAGDPDAGGEI